MVRLPILRTSAAISVLAAFVVSGVGVATPTPAAARVNISIGLNVGGIGFGYFHRDLSRRGHWINHPIWGDVWVPPRSRSYRPYFNGYWTYSDYGLLWVGYDPWSDVTDHYGRWVRDRYYGWLWIPGYVWGPGWVVWRTGGGYFGWMPMPPDYGDYNDGPYFGGRYSYDDYYGYSDWYGYGDNDFFGLWIFVDDNHFYRRDYRSYAFYDSRRVRNVIRSTNDSTNYAVQGDRIVNRSIPADRLERITHQRIEPIQARSVIKGNVPMATVSGGRGLARQEGSGREGPHAHDRSLRPIAGGNEGARGGANADRTPLIKAEPKRDFGGRKGKPETEMGPGAQPAPNAGEERGAGRKRGGENEAAPAAPLPQPNAGEGRGAGRKPGGEKEATPSPQPQPKANEDNGRGRKLGGEKEATPSPQPLPNAGDDRGVGRKPGGEKEATPSPQPQPKAGEDNGPGRNRGNNNAATPSPQPQPDAGEGGGNGRNRGGKTEGQTQGASPGAAGQEKQGREHPKANEKKKGEEPPANPDEEKEKKKKPDQNETSPNDNGPNR